MKRLLFFWNRFMSEQSNKKDKTFQEEDKKLPTWAVVIRLIIEALSAVKGKLDYFNHWGVMLRSISTTLTRKPQDVNNRLDASFTAAVSRRICLTPIIIKSSITCITN